MLNGTKVVKFQPPVAAAARRYHLARTIFSKDLEASSRVRTVTREYKVLGREVIGKRKCL